MKFVYIEERKNGSVYKIVRSIVKIWIYVYIYIYMHGTTRHLFSGEFIQENENENENEPSQKSNQGNLIKNIGRRTTIAARADLYRASSTCSIVSLKINEPLNLKYKRSCA